MKYRLAYFKSIQMKIENADFNEEFWNGKTEAEFLKHEAHHGLSTEKLKEVHAAMQKKPEAVKVADKKENAEMGIEGVVKK